MFRRAAALLCRRPAASHRVLPRHPLTARPAPSGRHPQVELGGAPSLRRLGRVGARGYARMARRVPPARPDGYSTSDGEADESDACGLEEELVPGAGAEGDDAEGSEWEGFMLDFGSGSDNDGDEEAEEGAGEGKK
ncbi:uncharacterized protein LOC133885353 [Phragmites australis]|uniref:uncharacterized protein LOC133885353 n=1 Tax=Phragmites australis TaxID=29695 RepID=UPI002D790BD9|nr:uncharacterized protein LOC133885353 [Phragmites australis]